MTWTIHTQAGTITDVKVTDSLPSSRIGDEVSVELILQTGDASTFQDYAFAAGDVATGLDIDGQPFYREQLPVLADVSSIVMGLEPPADARGIWGVLLEAANQSTGSLTDAVYDSTFFVLSRYAAHSTHSDAVATYQA